MSKNIVVLNGSPRLKGNTAGLIQAFVEGAESAGNKVSVFNLGKMNIHGCLGCCGGDSIREYPCVQKDDMQMIYPAILEAEVVVLASPLYYWNMSGQLRCTVDRLFALEEGSQKLRGHDRSGLLLMAAAGNAFEDVKLYYDHLMDHLQWKNLGSVLAGGVWNAGDIQGQAILEEARAAGASIQ